jgi:hypothetical protein
MRALSLSRLPLLLCLPMALLACSGSKDSGDSDGTGDDDDGTGDDDDAPVDCSTRPTDIPTARGEVDGAYSPTANQFMFFGGDEGVPNNCVSQTSFVDDTWVFEEDCGNWRQITGGTSPDPASRYASAYDAARDRFVIQGGRFRDGTTGDYTLRRKAWGYSFADEAWTLLAEDGGPSVRAIHAGAVVGDQFIIHGGTGSKDGLSYIRSTTRPGPSISPPTPGPSCPRPAVAPVAESSMPWPATAPTRCGCTAAATRTPSSAPSSATCGSST